MGSLLISLKIYELPGLKMLMMKKLRKSRQKFCKEEQKKPIINRNYKKIYVVDQVGSESNKNANIFKKLMNPYMYLYVTNNLKEAFNSTVYSVHWSHIVCPPFYESI